MDPLSASSHLLCAENSAAVASWDGGDEAADEWATPPPSADDADEERRSVAAFLAAEPDHIPRTDYMSRVHSGAADASARLLAVDWILKVNKFYLFRPVTAYLAVNYLDRFLSSHSLPPNNGKGCGEGGGGWPMQLLSVACVSVAAKMEETHVPLLLDLQILDPGFVFEPRTIRRMELLLMSALHWRMRSVTPFDFLRNLVHSASVVAAAGRQSANAVASLLSRASDLILQTHLVIEFSGYLPSAIAAAAVCCAARDLADSTYGDIGDSFSGHSDWIDKESVSRCRQLMEERLLDSRRASRTPPSPVGVLDAAAAACGSCNSSVRLSSSAAADDDRAESVQPAKRRRVDELLRCTESIDYY